MKRQNLVERISPHIVPTEYNVHNYIDSKTGWQVAIGLGMRTCNNEYPNHSYKHYPPSADFRGFCVIAAQHFSGPGLLVAVDDISMG